MIRNKYIDGLAAFLMSLALAFTLFLAFREDAIPVAASKTSQEYESAVFGGEVFTLEIIADEATWKTMLENAMQEEYICVDVVVNGTKFSSVGIRPKGNSSLSQVAGSDSDRYSFRLKFDEYVKGQTCFGLDSFVVNNMIGDSTYRKEYVTYQLMKKAGVNTPCVSFANITVNGENWGLYLAVELYNDSFEERVYGDTSGMLYNVKSMDIGGGNREGLEGQKPMQMPDGELAQPPGKDDAVTGATTAATATTEETKDTGNTQQGAEPNNNAPQSPDKGAQMEGRGSRGGDLLYTDDELSSYGAIVDNVVGKGSEEDYKRVVKALKALSEGEDLERYFDVDQILRYLAVHTFVVNLDSYTSSMAQNYYLYERDGRLTVLPWDYNLAWGGFQSGNSSAVINFPIDTPVSGVELSQRPLIAVLLANEEYLARYHTYLQELLDTCFTDGAWESMIAHIDGVISDYVAQDSTAFCSFEQYKEAVSAFERLGLLRAESVKGQLEGSIPATTEGQKDEPEALIQEKELSLATMGSMNGGKGGQMGMGKPQVQGFDPAAQAGNFAPKEQDGAGVAGGRKPEGTQQSGSEGSYPLLWTGASLGLLLGASVLVLCWKRSY